MTRKEFIKRAMSMRPTAKQWRELVERVVDYPGICDYKNAEDSLKDVHPLVGAIHEHYAKWHISGSASANVRRAQRRTADRYHAII